MPNNIYDFQTTSLKGEPIDFKDFKGKVLLIVNTASKCGLTPQYTALQELHSKYASQGLVIIGFPCNQFGGQEPGDAKEIEEECLVNYGVTFLMAHKVDVNGKDADPIFVYLKEVLPGMLGIKPIEWNFAKFLIRKDGTPYKRFSSTNNPKDMVKDIEELLSF
jgi:glutathione peroxidase